MRLEELNLQEASKELSWQWPSFRERSGLGSPFLHPDYMRLWATAFGRSNDCRIVVALRDGELTGFGPFMVETDTFGPLAIRCLRFIGHNVGYPGDILYLDIAASGLQTLVVRSILEHVSRWRIGKWDLGYLPPASETRILTEPILGARHSDGPADHKPYSVLALPRDWDAFFGGLSRNTRTNFNRRLRRLGSLGEVSIRMARTPSLVGRTVEEMIRNHEKWWKGTQRETWFGDEVAKRFLVEAARFLAEKGGFLAFALEVGGTPIAWNAGAYDRGHYFEQVISFDRSYSPYAPGALLGMLIVRNLGELGARCVELGSGFDERKRSLGGIPVDFERYRGYRGMFRALAAARDAWPLRRIAR